MSAAETAIDREEKAAPRRFPYYRHTVLVRTTLWINLVCIVLLLMSGMAIFNAHPALYLGPQSDFTHPILNLGMSADSTQSRIVGKPFPDWLTNGLELPNGRRWHLFVVWVFVLN